MKWIKKDKPVWGVFHKRSFLWLPREIDKDMRWLEFADRIYARVPIVDSGYEGNWIESRTIDVAWSDDPGKYDLRVKCVSPVCSWTIRDRDINKVVLHYEW
jgi:hypothetical protein